MEKDGSSRNTKPDVAMSDSSGLKSVQNKKNGTGKVLPPRTTRFKGRCDEMGEYVYDRIGSKQSQAESYSKTTQELVLYVGKSFNYGDDIRVTIENMSLVDLTADKPAAPSATKDGNMDETDREIWKEEIKEFVRRKNYLNKNIKKLYSLIWGQCSDMIRSEIEAMPGFPAASKNANALDLLKMIRSIAHNFQHEKNAVLSLHTAKRAFYFLNQGHDNGQVYYKKFNTAVDVLEEMGGSIGKDPMMVKEIIRQEGLAGTTLTSEKKLDITKKGRDQYLAMAFLLGSDQRRFGKLVEDLGNDFLLGTDSYPKTLITAYNVLTNWQQNPRNIFHGTGPSNDGAVFNIIGTPKQGAEEGKQLLNQGLTTKKAPEVKTPDITETPIEDVECYYCHEKGHYASTCQRLQRKKERDAAEKANTTTGEGKATGTNLLMDALESGEFDDIPNVGVQFLQDSNNIIDYRSVVKDKSEGKVNQWWILLDNQSTCDVFYNGALLTNIYRSTGSLEIHCNAGKTSTNLKGMLPGYGEVWYHPSGIANVLSLVNVKNAEGTRRITYDSKNGNQFTVEKTNGSKRNFVQSKRGLYYLDVQEEIIQPEKSEQATTLVNTVANNKSKYSQRDYSRAVLARRIQKIIGRPGTRKFIEIVKSRELPNCPITPKDILAAEHIFGTDTGSLMGKTTRRGAQHVRTTIHNPSAAIMEQYRQVTICIDVMKINMIAFFVTISRHIKFATVEHITNMLNTTLTASIKQVCDEYKKRGFTVTTAHADGQFESLRGELAVLGVTLNVVSKDEHVPEIERFIRTNKERVRAEYCMLPYTHLPKRLIIELVYRNVFWTNSFTSKGGISKTQSPRSIVTGIEINYKDHCQLEFGEYVHTHEEHDNSMQPRTIGALALRPTGNAQGGHFFLSLHTGRVINRRQRAWTRLPMPQEVINQVHRLARRNNAPPGLTFQDRHNVVTPEDYNDVDDETYVPDINDETSEDQNPDTESDQEELSDEQAEESNEEEEEEIEISEESTVEENEDSEEKSEHSGSEEGEQPESNEEGIEDEEDSTSKNEEQSKQNNANNYQAADDSDSDDEPDNNNNQDNNMIDV